MGRRLGISLVVVSSLFATGMARGEIVGDGTLRVQFQGSFAPLKLPRERPAPVTVQVEGVISTTDGSRPPALRNFKIGLNRHGRLTSRGLPRCRATILQSTTSDGALERCRGALVGRGKFSADIELSAGGLPTTGPILIFNSQSKGRPGLLLHLYARVPVHATLVLPLTISRARGEFGTVLSARIPRLAGGLGSITGIEMKIGRTYRHRGERLSYLSAACAAPAGFSRIPFPFAVGDFSFADGKNLDISITRYCRVR